MWVLTYVYVEHTAQVCLHLPVTAVPAVPASMTARAPLSADAWELPPLPDGASYTGVSVLHPSPRRRTRYPRTASPWSSTPLTEDSRQLQSRDAYLPAQQHYDEIQQASSSPDICNVRGAPGSGKSTQISQIIAESRKCRNGWSSQ